MSKTKCWGGKIAVVLCSGLLGMQTGCIFPGKHGGPPGLPPLPGLPRVELPNSTGVPVMIIASKNPDRHDSAPFLQNEKSANTTITQGESYE